MRAITIFKVGVVGLVALRAACAAEPSRFTSEPARVSLIELYTSEGCSSCPPAERWLGGLRSDPGLWKTFVPVAFHVDYWNRLGWPDRFSNRDFTQRQYAYAEGWSGGSVYTPCFVRDGAEWHARGPVEVSGGAAGVLTATYDGRRSAPSSRRQPARKPQTPGATRFMPRF